MQDDLTDTLKFIFVLSKHVLQDCMGVLVCWDLGVSPSRALQHQRPHGLLLFQHVSGDIALRARGQTQQPCLE